MSDNLSEHAIPETEDRLVLAARVLRPQMTAELSGEVDGVPERFVPGEMHGQLVEAEHMARYWWATNFCAGRRVLDAGCGVGYGAELLRQAGASEVVAVDISEAVIQAAQQVVSDGVVCEVADIHRLPYPNDSFDMVVCFETIEHVDEQGEALDELARVLCPDGLLLISSPNRKHYVPGNPHHRHEYTPAEFDRELKARFEAVSLVQQHSMIATVINQAGEAFRGDARIERLVAPGSDDEIYTLAIAGKTLPASSTVVALTQFLETRQWIERLEGQQRVLEEQAGALREVDLIREERQQALEQLAERESTLAELPTLRERLSEAEAGSEQLKKQVQELGERLAQMDRAVKLADEMRGSISWRVTTPLRRLAAFRRRVKS